LYKILTAVIFVFSFWQLPLFAEENQIPDKINKTVAEEIEEINLFSQTEKIPKAIALTENILKKYPDNKELNLLYAKLLFWNDQPDDAKKVIEKYREEDKTLYKKIYLAWAVKVLKEKKTSHEKLNFIKKIKKFARESYDVLWIEIQSSIEEKNIEQALTLSQKLATLYPDSREAQERFAVLLFWNGKYEESLTEYQKLGRNYHADYKKQITQLEEILHEKSKEIKREERAKTDKKKKEKLNTATSKKKKEPVEPAEMDKKHLAKYMTGMGYQKADYSDNRYRDRTKYFEMTLPVNEYTLYLKVQDTDRYNLNDKKIVGEFYPKLPDPQWGYLSFSYTPDTDFFSHYSIGWHHFYGWQNWQFGAGCEWSRYSTEDITLLSAEYSYYFTEFLFGRQVFYYVPDNHSWACLNQLKYQTPQHFEWYVDYIISQSNEEISETNLLKGTDIDHIKFGGEYPLDEHFTIGGNLGKEWLSDKYHSYTRTYFEFFVRVYW